MQLYFQMNGLRNKLFNYMHRKKQRAGNKVFNFVNLDPLNRGFLRHSIALNGPVSIGATSFALMIRRLLLGYYPLHVLHALHFMSLNQFRISG